MNLKQLIEYLEKKDPDMVVPMGFDDPHSYRGDYMCLAFEPARNVTVRTMLQFARDSVGTVYQGWKGGEYRMVGGTEVYLAMYRRSGEKIGTVLLDYMTGVYDSEECKFLRGVIIRSTDEVAGLIAGRDCERSDLVKANDLVRNLVIERDHVQKQLALADVELFEYRKQIVEQSKTIHDLFEEKIQVNRAIDAMTGTISEQNEFIRKQNQILLHVKAELEVIKQFDPLDLVVIDGSVENISNIIKDNFKPFIDEECAGCCMSVDVAAKLQKELEEWFEIKLVGCRRLFDDYGSTIRELSVMVDAKMEIIKQQSNTIEDLKTEVDRLRSIIHNELWTTLMP